MPLLHWSFIFPTDFHLINFLTTLTLTFSRHIIKLFGTSSNYSKLRSFGYLCYTWFRPYSAHRIVPHSSPCVFLGYSPTQSAYLCLDPSSSRIYTSRHVKFVESIFPFATIKTDLDRPSPVTLSHWCSLSLPIVNISSSRFGSAPSTITPNASHLLPNSAASILYLPTQPLAPRCQIPRVVALALCLPTRPSASWRQITRAVEPDN